MPNENQPLTFAEWYTELQRIADEHSNASVIGSASEHLQAYKEGDMPEDEYLYRVECALWIIDKGRRSRLT